MLSQADLGHRFIEAADGHSPHSSPHDSCAFDRLLVHLIGVHIVALSIPLVHSSPPQTVRMVTANPLFTGGKSVTHKLLATVITDIWPEVLFFTSIAASQFR